MVPIWFVWVNKSLYIATEKKSVKVGNVQSNPNVSTCLEDGLRALICNGTATLLEVSEMTSVQQQGVIKGFEAKYNWNLSTGKDDQYVLIEIVPKRWIEFDARG